MADTARTPCGVTSRPGTKPPWPRSTAHTAAPGASGARPQSPASNSLVDVDRRANNGLTNSIHQGKNQGPGDALGLGLLQNIVGIALPGHPTAAAVAQDGVDVKHVGAGFVAFLAAAQHAVLAGGPDVHVHLCAAPVETGRAHVCTPVTYAHIL